MRKTFLLAVMFLPAPRLSASGAPSDVGPSVLEVARMDASKIEVQFKHSIAGKQLVIEYSVINRSDVPIFVFDQFFNRRKKRLDNDRVYVRIAGKAASLRRGLEPLPGNVTIEHPEAPLAREVPVGGIVKGSFRVSLPLNQTDSYGEWERAGMKEVAIENLQVEIGWCPRNAMDEYPSDVKPLKIGGTALWPFSFFNIQATQKFAMSTPIAIELTGRSF